MVRAMPLHIEAALRHRTRSLPVQRAACDAMRSPRGQAFAKASGSGVLDVCAPEPVTLIARAEAWIGLGAAAASKVSTPSTAVAVAAGPSRPLWRRLYEHGLGLGRA